MQQVATITKSNIQIMKLRGVHTGSSAVELFELFLFCRVLLRCDIVI